MYGYLKRIASILLAAAMVLTLFPAYALAAETEENGISSELVGEELPGADPVEESEVPPETASPAENSTETASPVENPPEETPEDDLPGPSDPPASLYGEAASGNCGKDLTWTLDEMGTLTISGSGGMAYNPFRGVAQDIKKVVIEPGVTSISASAFDGCTGLTNITIPEGVTSIRYYAFRGCTGLTSVTIPESVTDIDYYTFEGCTGLTSAGPIGGGYSYQFGWTVAIPEYAFSCCTGLTSVTIPESVSSIGSSAFEGCTSLTNVTILGGVTSIGDSAFSGCTGLTSITIPKGVTSIGDSAFSGCTGLTSIIIPESVTSIGYSAFYGCSSLTTAGPTGDGNEYSYQFGWTTAIPEYAFYNCSGLTSVTIPEGVTSIGVSAFQGCTGLTSAGPIGGDYSYQFGWTTEIPEYAFYNCSGLTSVSIPESITSIGSSAFYGCSGLTSAGPTGDDYGYQFGWKTSIPDYAFKGCTGLTSITIPAGVTSIGDSAFSGCSGLTNITIPESITSIGSSAFWGCTGLTSVTIPEGVTSIGSSAFSGCTGLTSAGPTGGDYSYQFGWKTSIPNYAFKGCSGLTSVTIPEGVTSIGGSAFEGCTGLTNIIIPESVTDIDSNSFFVCSGLTSAGPIGGGYDYQFGWTTTIPKYAFHYCTGLTNITIPEGVTSIGNPAFWGCSSLTSITIPESVTSISSGAFQSCSSDLCIYCYSGSCAETYAIENNIHYAILRKDDNEIATWLTTNASGGAVAGTDFLVRTGYSALNAARLQVDLSDNIALSSVWLDGKELTSDAYTRENGSLTVPVSGLPDKPAHTLHMYCAATAAGTYNFGGRLAMINGETHSLGTAAVQVGDARHTVPEKVGYTKGIIATGRTAPGCAVTLFVDGVEAGHTTANQAGSWKVPFDLASGAEDESVHTVCAKIQLANGGTVETTGAEVTYQACAVAPLKLTMYNTGDHGAQETVFDLKDPEKINLIPYYRIWPSRFPSFTFKAEFSGESSTLGTVSIVTVSSAGAETEIPASYDPSSHTWVGTCDYNEFQNAPVWVYVRYSKDGICSNRFCVTPIMDPSGYVYEAVPSNRLAGVTAVISCEADNGASWNAAAYDQINPQTTGADGSYYWDVPAGNWMVSFTKEGYEAAETGWLPVPPPQVDINVSMVSTAAPEVKYAAVYTDYAEITFSQYMDLESVQNAVTLNGTAALMEPLNAEYNADKTAQYATRFRAEASGLSGKVTLDVSTTAKNYAGTPLENAYSENFSIETRPTGITAPETVNMEMSAAQNIGVTLAPQVSGRRLTVENLTPAILRVHETAVITGGNGGAEIPVEALLPGTGILRISEPASGLETTVSVRVKSAVAPEISIEASIANGILTYSVQGLPEAVNAKLIVASYEDQRMSKAVILESTNGTWNLPDAPTGSYVLLLVEAGTWKPLCPKYPV